MVNIKHELAQRMGRNASYWACAKCEFFQEELAQLASEIRNGISKQSISDLEIAFDIHRLFFHGLRR